MSKSNDISLSTSLLTSPPSFAFNKTSEIPTSTNDDSLENDTPKGYDKYSDRYVAFVDILGFKELIRRNRDQDLISSLVSALDISPECTPAVLAELGVSEDSVDLRTHTFSDFVVASTPATAAGLGALVFTLWKISTIWASSKLFCRGGIARGDVLHRHRPDEGPPMVFGPAFIDAYVLESTVADYPRIVLSKSVREDWIKYVDAGNLGTEISKLVKQCEDGPRCVDIFSHLQRQGFSLVTDESPKETKQIHDALKSAFIETSDEPKHFRKISWLVAHFNKAIVKTRYSEFHIDVC